MENQTDKQAKEIDGRILSDIIFSVLVDLWKSFHYDHEQFDLALLRLPKFVESKFTGWYIEIENISEGTIESIGLKCHANANVVRKVLDQLLPILEQDNRTLRHTAKIQTLRRKLEVLYMPFSIQVVTNTSNPPTIDVPSTAQRPEHSKGAAELFATNIMNIWLGCIFSALVLGVFDAPVWLIGIPAAILVLVYFVPYFMVYVVEPISKRLDK